MSLTYTDHPHGVPDLDSNGLLRMWADDLANMLSSAVKSIERDYGVDDSEAQILRRNIDAYRKFTSELDGQMTLSLDQNNGGF